MNGIKLIEKGSGSDLLKKRCREIGVPISLIRELVQAELKFVGMQRRRGINDEIHAVLSEYVGAGDEDVFEED